MNIKKLLGVIGICLFISGCAGSGGPVERTGRTVDHGVEKVGSGVKKVGEKIEDVSN